jgi:hypothetical protein
MYQVSNCKEILRNDIKTSLRAKAIAERMEVLIFLALISAGKML